MSHGGADDRDRLRASAASSGGRATSRRAIYSRSLLGRKDFGVNRARLTRRLAALDMS